MSTMYHPFSHDSMARQNMLDAMHRRQQAEIDVREASARQVRSLLDAISETAENFGVDTLNPR